MATKKSTGTVKWFSNRKGFGFIAPTSDNCPTKEDIFVHQTSIVTDGDYRTLQENATVEFEVVTEADTGKFKAVNVTGIGGTPIVPPAREPRRRRQPRSGKKEGGGSGDHEKGGGDNANAANATSSSTPGGAAGESGDEENKASNNEKTGAKNSNNSNRRGRGRRNNTNTKNDNKSDDEHHQQHNKGEPQKPRDPPFHSIFTEDVKKKIADKNVELGRKSTVDVAMGGSRIKLGQGGYAAFADAKGIVGEGTYKCDENAKITFEWKRAIEYDTASGEWKVSDAGKLMKELSLTQDGIGPVKDDETPETLWGADKPDPKDVIQKNEFLMRRVALTRPRGRGRRGPPRSAKKDHQPAAKE